MSNIHKTGIVYTIEFIEPDGITNYEVVTT